MFTSTRPKSKKGQILIFVLVLMAMGLIIITPLLHFLNTSYTAYTNIMIDSNGYYAADAMMGNILNDMAAGQDVLNQSANYNKSQPGGWLNGCNINTTISSSINSYIVPEESEGWSYSDPGFSLYDPLAYSDKLDRKVYLTEGSNVTVHWYFSDTNDQNALKTCSCPYYANGSMWITNASGGTVSGDEFTVLTNGPSLAFNQSLGFQVNQSGNYTVHFRNWAERETITTCLAGCSGPTDTENRKLSFAHCGETSFPDVVRGHYPYLYACQSPFGSAGAMDHTWIKIGTVVGDDVVVQYSEYTITTIAKRGNTNVASITAHLRQTPGPNKWNLNQKVEIVSWETKYY